MRSKLFLVKANSDDVLMSFANHERIRHIFPHKEDPNLHVF